MMDMHRWFEGQRNIFFLNLKLHVFFLNFSSFCWFICLLDSIDGILWFLGCYYFWKLTRIVLSFLKQRLVNISGLPFIPWLDSLIGANMQALQSPTYGMKGGSKAVSAMIRYVGRHHICCCSVSTHPLKNFFFCLTNFWLSSKWASVFQCTLRNGTNQREVMKEFWKHSTQLDMMVIILRPC